MKLKKKKVEYYTIRIKIKNINLHIKLFKYKRHNYKALDLNIKKQIFKVTVKAKGLNPS